MDDRNFQQMLEARWASGTLVCLGLDSDYKKIPAAAWGVEHGGNSITNAIVEFNYQIVKATCGLVCAYKPNLGFYLKAGSAGIRALELTIEIVNELAPEVPVILDLKVGEIDNTLDAYAVGMFDVFKSDAVTINPYMGGESLASLFAREGKGFLVLVRTSNTGSGEFQDLGMQSGDPLYTHVGYQFSNYWNSHGNCGVVVGATYPRELAVVRSIVGNMPILCPGVGAQEGDLRAAVESGVDEFGAGLIVNSSRGIIFASNGVGFADAARAATMRLRDDINRYRGA